MSGTFEISQDTLGCSHVHWSRIRHVLRELAGGEREVGARESHQILKSSSDFLVLVAKMRVGVKRAVAIQKMGAGFHGRKHRRAVRHIEAFKKFANQRFLSDVDVVAVLLDVEADVFGDETTISAFEPREKCGFERRGDIVGGKGEENIVDVIDEMHVIGAICPAQERVGTVHRSKAVGEEKFLEGVGPRSRSDGEAIEGAFEFEDGIAIIVCARGWAYVNLGGGGQGVSLHESLGDVH